MHKLELLQRQPNDLCERPPLLFVHGVCHGAWCWDEFYLPYFASKGWNSYALSLRGHAGSPGREQLDTFGLQDYVDDVLNAIARIGAKPILIGHSMGGGIAQLTMQRAPEQLAGAVLLASMPPGWLTTLESLRMSTHPLATLAAVKLLQGKSVSANEVRRMPFMSNRISREQSQHYAKLLQPESKRAVAEIPKMTTRAGPAPVPLLVLGSRRDWIFGESAVQRTAKHYATSAVILDQGCHDLMLDPDWQRSADVILLWLDSIFRRQHA